MGLLFEIAVLVLAHLLVVAVAGLGFANLLLVAMAELDAMHHLQIPLPAIFVTTRLLLPPGT